jgi:hypothetical protein
MVIQRNEWGGEVSKAQNIQVMFRLLKKIKRKANYWLYSPFERVIIPLQKLLCTRCNCEIALKELMQHTNELFPSEATRILAYSYYCSK